MQAIHIESGATVEYFAVPVHASSGRMVRPAWWGDAFRAGQIAVAQDGAVTVGGLSARPGDVVVKRGQSLEVVTAAEFATQYRSA